MDVAGGTCDCRAFGQHGTCKHLIGATEAVAKALALVGPLLTAPVAVTVPQIIKVSASKVGRYGSEEWKASVAPRLLLNEPGERADSIKRTLSPPIPKNQEPHMTTTAIATIPTPVHNLLPSTLSLHVPGSCPCRACIVATTPAGAANIADWREFAARFPTVAIDANDTTADPFEPTAAELDAADALNVTGESLFDLLGYDPFAADAFPVLTAGEWPVCPVHGFHDAADNGEPLSFCEKCEER